MLKAATFDEFAFACPFFTSQPYGTTASVSTGYSGSAYDISSSVSEGRKTLERVARSLGYTYDTYMKMESAKAEERRSAEASSNKIEITVNANGLNAQQATNLANAVVDERFRKEGLQ